GCRGSGVRGTFALGRVPELVFAQPEGGLQVSEAPPAITLLQRSENLRPVVSLDQEIQILGSGVLRIAMRKEGPTEAVHCSDQPHNEKLIPCFAEPRMDKG